MQPTLSLKKETGKLDCKYTELYKALLETLPLEYAMLLAIWRWVAYSYQNPVASYKRYVENCQVDELRTMIPVQSQNKRGAYHLSQEGSATYGVWKHQPTVSVTLIPYYRGSMQKIKAIPRRPSDVANKRNMTLSMFPWLEECHPVSIARRRLICFACTNVLHSCLFAQKQLWPVPKAMLQRRPRPVPPLNNIQKPHSEQEALKEWESW